MLHVDLVVPLHGHGEQRFSADVAPGSVLALFGPSGSGKTTVIRTLVGLHQGSGTLRWEADDLLCRPVHARPFAWVPQDPSLFPHWTLRRQVDEARPRGGNSARVDELFRALMLTNLQHRPGRLLSGGQQQRGELARALAREPAVLLLDEPFSALDGPTRVQIGQWLRDLVARERMAMVMASHDWSDVEAWADEVVLLDEGRIAAKGSPGSLFRNPPNWSAARLLGYETRIKGRALHPDLADFATPLLCPVVVVGHVQARTPHGAGVRVKLRTEDGIEVHATVPPGAPVPDIESRVEVGFHAPEVRDA